MPRGLEGLIASVRYGLYGIAAPINYCYVVIAIRITHIIIDTIILLYTYIYICIHMYMYSIIHYTITPNQGKPQTDALSPRALEGFLASREYFTLADCWREREREVERERERTK